MFRIEVSFKEDLFSNTLTFKTFDLARDFIINTFGRLLIADFRILNKDLEYVQIRIKRLDYTVGVTKAYGTGGDIQKIIDVFIAKGEDCNCEFCRAYRDK